MEKIIKKVKTTEVMSEKIFEEIDRLIRLSAKNRNTRYSLIVPVSKVWSIRIEFFGSNLHSKDFEDIDDFDVYVLKNGEKVEIESGDFNCFSFTRDRLEEALNNYLEKGTKSMALLYAYLYQQQHYNYPWKVCVKEAEDFKRMFYDKKK